MKSFERKYLERLEQIRRGTPALLIQTEGKACKAHLFAIADKDFKPFQAFFGVAGHASLLAASETAQRLNISGWLGGSLAGLPVDWSPKGLFRLIQALENGKELPRGDEHILLHTCDADRILSEESAEARLLEVAAHIDGSGLMVYAPLTGPDGEPLTEEYAEKIAKKHKFPVISVSEVKTRRFLNPRLLEWTGVTPVRLTMGEFQLHSFYSHIDRRYHWAFVKGDPAKYKTPPLVRVESECLTGHVFGSKLCDCGEQMSGALEKIAAKGEGMLIYLRQEGRGIGLLKKLQAYRLQQQEKLDTVDANLALGTPEDARDYIIGAQVLTHFNIEKLRLLTNNPAKVRGLEKYGLQVTAREAHIIEPTPDNQRYLATKKARLGHLF